MNVKIGTYNIQHGVDRLHYLKTKEWKVDLPAVIDAIRTMKPDICGLNEVWNNEGFPEEGNQTKIIAEELGYYYYFAKAINHRRGEYGNGLISKYPIVSTKLIPLRAPIEGRTPGGYYEDRVILVAELSINNQIVTIACTHFGLNRDEIEIAIEAVRNIARECKTPLLLMGDLNFGPTAGHYAKLCEILTDTAALMNKTENTFPSEAPNNRIDYIFSNGRIKIVDACVPELVVTDHRPYTVVAEI